MVKKLINNKIFKFSSITTISSLNICAGDFVIDNNSFINIEGYNPINISGRNFPRFTLMNNYDNLCTWLSNLFEISIYDGKNWKPIKQICGNFNDYILVDYNGNVLFNNYNDRNLPINQAAFNDFRLNITLIKKPCVRILYDYFNYRYNEDFSKKIDAINKDIVNLKYLTIGDFKKKLTDNLIGLTKFNIKYTFFSDVVNDAVDFVTCPICLEYNGDYSDYFEPCKTEIEFIAGDGLELDESVKKPAEIVFAKEKIPANTTIKAYIFSKYKGLNDTNCAIKYKDKRNITNYVICENYFNFYDGQNLKITINGEVTGISKKKIEKYNINVNFEVKDPSKYVFKEEINNINNLEVEQGKTYNDLLNIIKGKLGNKELKEGFKIYKNAKDSSNEFTDGLLENNVTYIVVFDETALGFVKEKDKGKIYINLKFDVTDNSKFKLKQGINDINSIEVEQGKTYNDLLNIIKDKLGNKELKEGFKIYKNDKNTEFKNGDLENSTTYIVVFVNDDINFVEEKPKTQTPKPGPQTPEPGPQTPKPKEQDQLKQDNKEDNNKTQEDSKNIKAKGCSGKNKKKCC